MSIRTRSNATHVSANERITAGAFASGKHDDKTNQDQYIDANTEYLIRQKLQAFRQAELKDAEDSIRAFYETQIKV